MTFIRTLLFVAVATLSAQAYAGQVIPTSSDAARMQTQSLVPQTSLVEAADVTAKIDTATEDFDPAAIEPAAGVELPIYTGTDAARQIQ